MKFFLLISIACLLNLSIICHSSDKHFDQNLNNKYTELSEDLVDVFKHYGNNTKSLNPNQLRKFLNNFHSRYFRNFINDSEQSQCLKEKISKFNDITNLWKNDTIINRDTFAKVSSYILSYVSKCFGDHNINENFYIKSEADYPSSWQIFRNNIHQITKEKWLYALVSVLLISVVGLLCVIFVPILNACCFDYLFQFLVALALGTLVGDAFLHLIPHAFMESHDHGTLLFLDDFNPDHHKKSHQAGVVKGLGCLFGIYIFFLIEKIVQMKQTDKPKKDTIQKLNNLMKNEYNPEEIEKLEDCLTKQKHNHTHSHGSNKAEKLKSNAWMVILGDALHNFSDGLAIGASFAASLTAGFGTTIAVFFHELPHEIGDFAVLRRAGVPMKKAVLFNIVSSTLCFFGVIVGIMIGGIEVLNNWSFLFIAGTFIYVSLVDIIPELNENDTIHDTKVLNFFIQHCGLFLGIGIMLLIALYEEEIHSLLD